MDGDLKGVEIPRPSHIRCTMSVLDGLKGMRMPKEIYKNVCHCIGIFEIRILYTDIFD